ncbi:hypothetical protein F444_06301 [Phytophthora nicotianae P1976]|uniref:HAT C-terminal dimerisation domain-containing protein n=1 Tax=Phytophthora nicotianae P1976 TaxID=1317066 RepID=A0A081AJ19_PHYNI|nr:hypothetical protein F444_06301 [Phytophthora nicotianae P1976]
MVRATRPSSAYTNAQISGFYFRPCRDEYGEVILEYFRCRCGTVRKQTNRNGFSNLMQHILRRHPDHEAVMLDATTADTGSMTLRAGMEGVTRAIERKLAAELPTRFGVGGSMLQSTTWPGSHVALRVLGDDFAKMLPRDFGVQIDQCRFIVGDNCSVNRLLATIMGVLLVGCASHRLNRAVQQYLLQHEDDLAAVQALMIKLRTLTQSAKLHLKTELRPVIHQDTCWSSTFGMLKRYFQLLEFLDAGDDDIMEVLPSPASNKRHRALFKGLKDVESVAKALQGRDVDLLDVRRWFDELIALKPQFETHFGSKAEIVHSPDFESGCVRVLRGRHDRLTRVEKTTLGPFAKLAVDATAESDDEDLSFVERLRKRRRIAEPTMSYKQLKTVPPTYNVVERFFSVARVTFGHQRHGLLPATLEMILFLRENRGYWDSSTVNSIN